MVEIDAVIRWKRPMSIEIKTGKHAGELGVIVETLGGVHKVLTLEGDFHFYDDDGVEQI